jgi:hypothetical protein
MLLVEVAQALLLILLTKIYLTNSGFNHSLYQNRLSGLPPQGIKYRFEFCSPVFIAVSHPLPSQVVCK